MFSINEQNDNGFDIISLHDTSSGCSVQIIPSCGGILHSFGVLHREQFLNIIENYNSKTEFDDSVEAKGFRSCKLSPFVCRLKEGKYDFAEKDYHIEKFYLGRHALHGLLYDASFSVIQLDAGQERALAEIVFAYKGSDKGYPFKYDCRIIYELKENNTLHLTSIVKNQESVAIPIADGWHPYFSFGGSVNELELSFQSKEKLEADSELIPTGKRIPYSTFAQLKKIADAAFDDCFPLDFTDHTSLIILKDPVRNIQLEIRPDRSYPFLQLYIPDHRNSIAIENLSAAPDAFNNEMGLIILPAGKEMVFKTSYTIKECS